MLKNSTQKRNKNKKKKNIENKFLQKVKTQMN